MRAAVLAACVAIAAVAVPGCAGDPPAAETATQPSVPSEECDCDNCGDDCDPDGLGWECVRDQCDPTGRCLCYVDTAAEDCPDTGCCAPQYGDDGELLVDDNGDPIYGCVVPACVTDSDCADGEVCVIGASCDQNYCTCDVDQDDDGEPDPDSDDDVECCAVQNDEGACCTTGEVDPITGLCVCSDPELMVDDGTGCACPTGMVPDEDGQCQCADDEATYDSMTGECHCPDTATEDVDADGVVHCIDPVECDDDNAYYDETTGECECNDGYHYGEDDDFVTPRCIPDDEEPDAATVDADVDSPDGPEPDAAPPDAAPPDAAPPDAPPPDAPPPPDAVPVHDAPGPIKDACMPSAIVHCQVEGVTP